MKIVRVLHDSKVSFGLLAGDAVNLLPGSPFDSLTPTGQLVPLARAKLLAPVAPPNILAIGLNYRGHAAETNTPLPERPLLFMKASSALLNPGDPIRLPVVAPNEVDFEAELAVVIGRAAKHVPAEKALDYVLGYTCANDVGARDVQKRIDTQWVRAKSFDTFCPLGPCIETDLDPARAGIRSRLNGRVMQDSNTSDLIFSAASLIAYLSSCMTLLPGTVLMTGTPPGVGVARKPPVFLRPGDTIEIEIDGVGVLSNPVVAETK